MRSKVLQLYQEYMCMWWGILRDILESKGKDFKRSLNYLLPLNHYLTSVTLRMKLFDTYKNAT